MHHCANVVRRLRSRQKVISLISQKLQAVTANTNLFTASHATNLSTQYQDDPGLWVASPHPKVELPEGVTLPELLRSGVKGWGKTTAYECSMSGRKYTHDQVYSMSRSFAAALIQSKKFQRGDVIGVVSQNTPEYFPAVLGIIEAGHVAAPTNPAYTKEELIKQLGLVSAKAVVTSPEFVDAVRAVKNSKQCPSLQEIIVTGEPHEGCHSFFEMAKVDATGVEFLSGSKCDTKQETCVLLFSSGTTGIPKGVELTHFNIIANLLQAGSPSISTIQFSRDGRQERSLGILPSFHVIGLGAYLAQTLYKGLHLSLLPRFTPPTFIEALRSHKPNVLYVVPPLLNFIATSPEIGKEDLKYLTTLGVGGAPLIEHMVHAFLEKATPETNFQHGYGMTETTSGVVYLDPGHRHKLTSNGRPVPNTITKLVDMSSGRTLGRNERGEVWVKGPQVMKGYFRNERATRECLDEDGWLRTGDIGYYDDEGYLFIVDRLKELIKVKGFQVAPSELEGLLTEHPDIADAAVFGVPDDAAGELPRAAIVRRNKSLTEDSVHAFLKDRVASFKQLRGGVEFVEAIPKAASGKLLKRELLRLYKEAKNIV